MTVNGANMRLTRSSFNSHETKGLQTNIDLSREPTASQNEASLSDSGYGTGLSSPEQNEKHDKGKHPIATPPKAIPFSLTSGRDLLVFKKDVDRRTIARFNEIVPEIEKLLLSQIIKLSRSSSIGARYKPMAIRLMVLGKSESDAKEYIVVFCQADLLKRVQSFFDKDPIIRDLCKPDDTSMPAFKVVVKPHAPHLRVALSDIHVHFDNSQPTNGTFCGTPIRLVNGTSEFRIATFGGIIKVNDGLGFKLYGMTAGHSLLEWAHTEGETKCVDSESTSNATLSCESKDIDQQDDSIKSFVDLAEPFLDTSAIPSQSEQDQAVEAWRFSETKALGRILKASSDFGNEDTVEQYFDWALFEVSTHRPNELHTVEAAGNTRKQYLSSAVEKLSVDAPSRPVTMMGGSQGLRTGVLSKLPGRIIIGPGNSFVDAYLLTLDDSQIFDGDSGSWVVDRTSLKVYGHVVATDMFGDAYVVPLTDTFADIQRRLGAHSVELPSAIDFAILVLHLDQDDDEKNDLNSHFRNNWNFRDSKPTDIPLSPTGGTVEEVASTTTIQAKGYDSATPSTNRRRRPKRKHPPDSGYYSIDSSNGPSPKRSPPKRPTDRFYYEE